MQGFSVQAFSGVLMQNRLVIAAIDNFKESCLGTSYAR